VADKIDTLELAILSSSSRGSALVFARYGSDVALAKLPSGEELKSFAAFRDRVNTVLLMNQQRPTEAELTQFGFDLFNYIVRDDIKRLYNRLPSGTLTRIHILTNRPDLQSLPWEYLQDPTHAPGPWLDRSIVRIIPSVGQTLPAPLVLAQGGPKIRILFVYADPANQGIVSWLDVKRSVEREFSARIPVDRFELNVVEGTLAGFTEALEQNSYDIFQFSGHGEVDAQTKKGRILLLSQTNNQSVPLPASDLAVILRARGIRLAILSACLTSAGSSADPFNIIAEALLRENIPAVVANQLPVPDKSVAAFVGSLYAKLLETGDIDLAVNEGRMRLWRDLIMQQEARLEWGIPTLYRHITGAQVFTTAGQPPPAQPPVVPPIAQPPPV
jgi:hypothetical protein